MSRQAVDQGHEQFLEAMRAGDVPGLMAVLTDDVTFYPPHEATRKGRAEVEAWAKQTFGAAKTERVTVSDRNVVVAGDWAIEIGAFVWAVSPVAGGATSENRGRFIAIWRRQTDGSWKAAHDLWNSSNPAAAMV
jgi:ketosteroid isomerase-like protein